MPLSSKQHKAIAYKKFMERQAKRKAAYDYVNVIKKAFAAGRSDIANVMIDFAIMQRRLSRK